jgi:hypothetical protein
VRNRIHGQRLPSLGPQNITRGHTLVDHPSEGRRGGAFLEVDALDCSGIRGRSCACGSTRDQKNLPSVDRGPRNPVGFGNILPRNAKGIADGSQRIAPGNGVIWRDIKTGGVGYRALINNLSSAENERLELVKKHELIGI